MLQGKWNDKLKKWEYGTTSKNDSKTTSKKDVKKEDIKSHLEKRNHLIANHILKNIGKNNSLSGISSIECDMYCSHEELE